jgi:prephenate dehydrogenase
VCESQVLKSRKAALSVLKTEIGCNLYSLKGADENHVFFRNYNISFERASPMRIAVIGGAGLMGTWFVKYFTSKGFATVLTDLRMSAAKKVAHAYGAELAHSNIQAAEGADIALVCVPIEETTKILLEIAPHMRKDSIIAEISSIKNPALEALRISARMGLKPLSLHPLFGPTAAELKGETIVVVPIVDEVAEVAYAKQLFDEAELFTSEFEEHDRAMAIILSLTYFMNIAFAGMLKREDLRLIRRLAGTTFTVQLAVTEGIMSEHQNLVISLLRLNPFNQYYFNGFIDEIRRVNKLSLEGSNGLFNYYTDLVEALKGDEAFNYANLRRQKAFRALKNK